MKFLFKIGLISILTYLLLDVGIRGEENGARPIVQGLAGFSLILVSLYNLKFIYSSFKIDRYWSYITIWRVFIVLMILYFLISLVGLPSNFARTSLRDIVVAIYIFSVIVFIFNGVFNNHLTLRYLYLVIIVVFFNGLLELYYAFSFKELKQGVEVINTSAGYIFVMILPLLMYVFQKDNFWIFLITLLLTILTGKRGALFIYILLFLYSIFNFSIINKSFKVNWKLFLFLFLLFLGFSFFLDHAYESFQYRMLTIENEERGSIASGRNIIWMSLLSEWYNANFFNLLFGFGFYSTINIEGHIAHNDFIQFLVDFGVIGVILYSLVLIKLFLNIKKIKRIDPYIYTLLIFSLLVWLGRAMSSGAIRTDNIILSISLGYLMAQATKIRIEFASQN